METNRKKEASSIHTCFRLIGWVIRFECKRGAEGTRQAQTHMQHPRKRASQERRRCKHEEQTRHEVEACTQLSQMLMADPSLPRKELRSAKERHMVKLSHAKVQTARLRREKHDSSEKTSDAAMLTRDIATPKSSGAKSE